MTAGPFVPLAVPRGSVGTENCRGQAGAARCYNPYACRFCFMRVDFYKPACYNKKNDRLAPPGGNV